VAAWAETIETGGAPPIPRKERGCYVGVVLLDPAGLRRVFCYHAEEGYYSVPSPDVVDGWPLVSWAKDREPVSQAARVNSPLVDSPEVTAIE
jgi:hypothetical protein